MHRTTENLHTLQYEFGLRRRMSMLLVNFKMFLTWAALCHVPMKHVGVSVFVLTRHCTVLLFYCIFYDIPFFSRRTYTVFNIKC